MIQPETFEAVTFNIQHGSDGIYKHPGDPDRVAQAIIQLDSDLIGLQEVDVNLSRSQFVNLAKYAAEKAGMQCYFSKSGTFQGVGEVGNAILVKGKIKDAETVPLAGDRHTVKIGGHEFNLPVRMPRNIQIARVAVAAGELTVGNTHISGKNPQMLAYAAKWMLAWHGPHMLTGDFNMNWDDVQECLDPFGFTVAQAPGVNSDHIAVRGLNIIEKPKRYAIPGLSDHDPVKGVYGFTKKSLT